MSALESVHNMAVDGSMKLETLDTVGAAGTKVTTAGVGMLGFGWITSTEFATFAGAVAAIGGFLVMWYYKRAATKLRERLALEENRRAEEEHQLRMARLAEGISPELLPPRFRRTQEQCGKLNGGSPDPDDS